MKKFALITAACVLLGAAGSSLAAGDATAGKAKSAACAACHGADGNSTNPVWPKLASQHPQYIAKQLHDFKGGDRKDPTMAPMAAPLSDQDMEDLAAYFSSQQIAPGTADQAQVALGEKIYRGGNSATGVAACIGCHGPTGAGNPAANFPHLASQHAPYVVKQLKAFRAGERANDAGQMMRNIAAKMTDEEIDAVAQYIAGLH